MSAYVEDLSVFFTLGDPGVVEALFTHAGGSAVPVNVDFTAAFIDPLGIESSHPRANGVEADFPSVAHDDTLVINGKTYKIKGVHPDGTGIVSLRLQEQ